MTPAKKGPVLGWSNLTTVASQSPVNVTVDIAAGTTPAAKLLESLSYYKVITTGDGDVTVRFDFAASHPVDTLALGLGNAPAAATVEARLFSDLYTTVVGLVPAEPAWGEASPDPNAAWITPKYWAHAFVDGAGDLAPVTARSGEIVLRGGAGIGVWELHAPLWAGSGSARLTCLPSWSPVPEVEPMIFNAGGVDDLGYAEPQISRTLLSQSFGFRGLSKADVLALLAAFLQGRQPIFWQLDPDGRLTGRPEFPPLVHRGIVGIAEMSGVRAKRRLNPERRRDLPRLRLVAW